jgi:4-hydroxyphenylacetate 3-hydroxylase N terminal
MGEGQVEDVTTHPATHAMVEEYAAWYDRHLDPAWQDLLLTPPNADRERIPLAYVMPKSAEDLTRMGRSFAKTTFLSAGNITHTPAYGNLIALGLSICALSYSPLRPSTAFSPSKVVATANQKSGQSRRRPRQAWGPNQSQHHGWYEIRTRPASRSL